jgi:hypothetical protein
MFRILVLGLLLQAGCLPAALCQGPLPITPFERSGGAHTTTHAECVAYYQALAERYPGRCALVDLGPTDAGPPLQLFVVPATSRPLARPHEKAPGEVRLFVLNGIHPGEPEGIDASMLLARELLADPRWATLRQRVTVCIVPMYNLGGVLNRGCCSRANQNGPAEYGFRGNSQNLDLNRDCVKQDSREARALAHALATWQPDLFIDTHTSNGADYQHTLTLIETQTDKLGPPLGAFLRDTLTPWFIPRLDTAGWPTVPYVVTKPGTDLPDSGLVAFLETPRYSTGLAALMGIPGYVVETHMLKPFPDRMRSTLSFLRLAVEALALHGPTLLQRRSQWAAHWQAATHVPFGWQVHWPEPDSVTFLGYTATYRPGPVTGLPLRHFDHALPWARRIAYWNRYTPTDSTPIPTAYILPQAWGSVASRLAALGVEMRPLVRDTTLAVATLRIAAYETVQAPYEGHYLHYATRATWDTASLAFRAGDLYIPARQPHARLLAELLDPRNPDSYFAWNFFDAILMQKEGFSDYVFEPRAAELLAAHPPLRAELEARRAQDPAFAASAHAQLLFIYQRSAYYEPTHSRYPVAWHFATPLPPTLFGPPRLPLPPGREPHE